MKRLLDIVISLSAILLFLPFGLTIAVILRLTGEGEVFYVQPRVGKDGRFFGLIKFVTMLKDSPNIGTKTVTVRNDPRVLPFGRLLRKAKLNEVPQLLNVLKGDMGIVGPRPLTPETFAYFPPNIQEQVVKVKPGLTGIGSIVFRDEESIVAMSKKSTIDCYREDIAPYKGELELWYIDNRSLWLDLKLIFLTALVVINPRNMLYRKVVPDLPQRE
jgi:lipopolysaccharide/colanic/teichoic acid biosynthesis glycosyltransferase